MGKDDCHVTLLGEYPLHCGVGKLNIYALLARRLVGDPGVP